MGTALEFKNTLKDLITAESKFILIEPSVVTAKFVSAITTVARTYILFKITKWFSIFDALIIAISRIPDQIFVVFYFYLGDYPSEWQQQAQVIN